MVPALVQLQGKQTFLKEISGVRIESKVELYIENKKVTEELGELQLTEFGVSGIPVFQVSRYAAYARVQSGKYGQGRAAYAGVYQRCGRNRAVGRGRHNARILRRRRGLRLSVFSGIQM